MDNNKINKKTQEAILQDAFRYDFGNSSNKKTFRNFILRQADKNGDGRLSLDEIIAIFKVI